MLKRNMVIYVNYKIAIEKGRTLRETSGYMLSGEEKGIPKSVPHIKSYAEGVRKVTGCQSRIGVM